MSLVAQIAAAFARVGAELRERPRRAVAVDDPASSSAADVHTTVVALLDALRDAGVIATSDPPENEAPTAAFTYSASDLTATFADTSTDSDGTIEAWSWDFGDGNTSTAQNPTHTYDDAGTYSVSLTVTDDDGATDDVQHDVTVAESDDSSVIVVGGYTLTSTSSAQRWPDGGPFTDHPTIDIPGTPVAGDKLIFVIGCTGKGPIDYLDTGLTEIAAIGGGGSDGMYVAEKTCDGSESGTLTVLTTVGASDWLAICVLVHAHDALDIVSHAQSGPGYGNASPVTIAGPADVATTGDNQLVLWLGSLSSTAETGALTGLSLPEGFVQAVLVQDEVREFIAAFGKAFASPTTATYDATATLTGSGDLNTYACCIVIDASSSEVTPTTFDPARLKNFTLSGGDLVASATGTEGIAAVANPLDAAAAAYYWEMQVTVRGNYACAGLVAASVDIPSASSYLGVVAGSYAAFSDASSNLDFSGASVSGEPPVFETGDVLRFSLVGGKLYFGRAGSGWWNAAAQDWTGDPATGVGAMVTGITGDVSPAVGDYDDPATVWTAALAPGSWAAAAPAGCTAWPRA